MNVPGRTSSCLVTNKWLRNQEGAVMNTRTPIVTSALAMALGLGLAVSAVADAPMHGRISYEAGGALVRGTSDDDWSYATINSLILPGDIIWADEEGTVEVEMSGGTFLRMADGSRVEMTSMPPSALFEGIHGAFYVQRAARSTGDVVFRTPAASVQVEQDTQVRIDVTGAGATTVSVRWGRAYVRAGNGAITLTRGQRVYVDPGYLPSEVVSFDLSREDSFDQWNRERARILAEGMDRWPKETPVQQTPIGMADLHRYGEWVYVDNRRYWRPTVVREYVPYRVGYWSYAPRIGYTWVSPHPFSYVTTHYGRWTHHRQYGWMWTYVDGWAPAWAYTVRTGPYFAWAPLDPWDRPVVTSSAYFTVDGVRIGIHATSYTHASRLYHGPAPVFPAQTNIFTTGDVHIWNIYAPSVRPSPRLRHLTSPSALIRDYSPRRVIRGPDIAGPRALEARSRVSELEQRFGGRGAVASIRAGERGQPTPRTADSRGASLREVRVGQASGPSSVSAREDGRLRVDRAIDRPGTTEPDRDRTIRASGGGSLADRAASAPLASRMSEGAGGTSGLDRLRATDAGSREAPGGARDIRANAATRAAEPGASSERVTRLPISSGGDAPSRAGIRSDTPSASDLTARERTATPDTPLSARERTAAPDTPLNARERTATPGAGTTIRDRAADAASDVTRTPTRESAPSSAGAGARERTATPLPERPTVDRGASGSAGTPDRGVTSIRDRMEQRSTPVREEPPSRTVTRSEPGGAASDRSVRTPAAQPDRQTPTANRDSAGTTRTAPQVHRIGGQQDARTRTQTTQPSDARTRTQSQDSSIRSTAPRVTQPNAPRTPERPTTLQRSAPSAPQRPSTLQRSAPSAPQRPSTLQRSAPSAPQRPSTLQRSAPTAPSRSPAASNRSTAPAPSRISTPSTGSGSSRLSAPSRISQPSATQRSAGSAPSRSASPRSR